jgi:hypothetical protein
MARIRNIKPEFYSHELLNDLQSQYPELNPMLVFSGLWTQCENSGVFSWSIRKLKLAILPFVEFDLEKSLNLLEKHGFVKQFVKDGRNYGFVYNFTKYQAISGSEKSMELKYPIPTGKDLSENSEQDNDDTMTEPGQDNDDTMTADLGLRTKDKGHAFVFFSAAFEPKPF